MNASNMTAIDLTERKRLMGLLHEPAAARYQDGINLYQFVRSNPVTDKDPTGLWDDGQVYWRKFFDAWVENYRQTHGGSDPSYSPGSEGAEMSKYYSDKIAQNHPGHSDLPGGYDFDYTRPDHAYGGLGPYANPAPHFQPRMQSYAQAVAAAKNCDAEAFGDALHYGQDSFSHNAGGWTFDPLAGELGHVYSAHNAPHMPGHDPDDPNRHPAQYAAAAAWTKAMLGIWDKFCKKCSSGWAKK